MTAEELSKYKSHLVGIWATVDKGVTEPAAQTVKKGNGKYELDIFLIHRRPISAITKAEVVCGSMSYILLRGRIWDSIVLNVQAPTEDKINATKFL
jgi:hypothetical protein